MNRHFIDIDDLNAEEILQTLVLSESLRVERQTGTLVSQPLKGKSILMIFEKPSLRTRLSFEQAIVELGGYPICMSGPEVGLGQREKVSDVAQVISGMVHGVVARVYEHQKLVELAENTGFPVVNALSDDSHPCQAVADILTLRDHLGKDLTGKTLVYVGDGNNVAKSLLQICPAVGMKLIVATPEGYGLPQKDYDKVMAKYPDAQLESSHDPKAALENADAVYTDTWVSMGKEEEKQQRLNDFQGFQLSKKLMSYAPEQCLVMHCLPAYRGIEITDEVIDGPNSVVFPQAHNRLHAQKGLLAFLYS